MDDEPSTSSGKRLRLSGTPGDNGSPSTDEDPSCFEESLPIRLDELACPICHNIIVNAHITECGHTYCHECITKYLKTSKLCLKCGYLLHKSYPNFMIEKFIRMTKRADTACRLSDINKDHNTWHKIISDKSKNLVPDDIEFLVEMIQEKKKKIEKSSKVIKFELFKEFHKRIRIRKQEQLDKLAEDLKIIRVDFSILKQIESSLAAEKDDQSVHDATSVSEYSSTSLCTSPEHTSSQPYSQLSSQQNVESVDFDSETNASKSTFASTESSSHKDMKSTEPLSQLRERKGRIKLLYDDLEECYLNLRAAAKSESSSSSSKASNSASTDRTEPEELNEFMEILNGTTLYGDFKKLCILSYGDSSESFDSSEPSSPINPPNTVSCIEFDKEDEFLAIGGIAAMIKLYDYSMLIDENVAPHPIAEISCMTKISSISWSNYYKNFMVSGDYGGAVTLWDASTKQNVNIFNEHLRRCWSVDCNKVDTKLFASGSDDGLVKLWSINEDNSILTMGGFNTNVCGVKWHPTSRYHLAFCSADNKVYYYDLRNPSGPEFIYRGHHDTVSYVQFMSSTELVSLSTDSTCKLWNIGSDKPYERTFKGHFNDHKFVGLATNDNYICCGSENNAIYFYYKGFSKPVLTYSFDFDRPFSSTGIESNWMQKSSNRSSISAVCWKKESNVILAGNTQGSVRVLELI